MTAGSTPKEQINHRKVILIHIWHDFRIHMCKAALKPIDSSTHKSTLQVYREKLVIKPPKADICTCKLLHILNTDCKSNTMLS
jgi:hypothetical protein